MNPFWSGFEHLKNCGRDATPFLYSLAGVFGLLVAFAIILQTEVLSHLLPALPWIGLVMAVWVYLAIRRAMSRRRQRLQRRPLSADELSKARCKLMRSGTQGPSPRASAAPQPRVRLPRTLP